MILESPVFVGYIFVRRAADSFQESIGLWFLRDELVADGIQKIIFKKILHEMIFFCLHFQLRF